MPEGRVYKVHWTHADNLFHLTLARRKSITAAGPTLEAALDQLADAVMTTFGDGEPQWKLDPCIPNHPSLARFDRYITLCPSAHWSLAQPAEDLFEGPRCKRCRTLHGRRNQKPLALNRFHGRGPVAVWLAEPGVTGIVATESAAASLPPETLANFNLVPAISPPNSRTKWLEIQPNIAIHEVHWANNPNSLRIPKPCRSCGALRPADYHPRGGDPTATQLDASFARASDLPAERPPAFALQCCNNWTLTVAEAYWSQIRGLPCFKTVHDDTVCCVIPDDEHLATSDTRAAAPAWPALS